MLNVIYFTLFYFLCYNTTMPFQLKLPDDHMYPNICKPHDWENGRGQFCLLFSTMVSILVKKTRDFFFFFTSGFATTVHFNLMLVLIPSFHLAAFSVHLVLHGRQVCRLAEINHNTFSSLTCKY